MNERFDQELKKHYASQSLSKEQLTELEGLMDQHRPQKPRRMVLFGAMVSGALALALIFWALPREVVPLDIAEEISYNHNARMAMEIQTDSLAVVAQKLDRLDFNLVQSRRLTQEGWRIVGARYCSISGRIAAQFQLTKGDGSELYTLYQAKWPDELQSFKDQSFEVDGNLVRIWQERGLLLGLAGP